MRFVEYDAGGHRHVEALHRGGRDSDVPGSAQEAFADAATLATDDEREPPRQVRLGEWSGAIRHRSVEIHPALGHGSLHQVSVESRDHGQPE